MYRRATTDSELDDGVLVVGGVAVGVGVVRSVGVCRVGAEVERGTRLSKAVVAEFALSLVVMTLLMLVCICHGRSGSGVT